MSYTSWFVGMEVVFARGKPFRWWPEEAKAFLKRGAVYTIDGIFPPEDPTCGAPFFVLLTGCRFQFDCRGFRPVQKRKTDISIFKRLLTDPNVKISEDA